MKIPGSIRSIYDSQIDHYINLQVHVDDLVTNFKKRQWHYESRVKEKQSFALKLETGRFDNPASIEDFFGCLLVVENQNEIKNAINCIINDCNFIEKYRRPRIEKYTNNSPESFRFDDLRLYVEWQDKSLSRPTGLNGTIFEIQIKTYLQHAWAIATHDLIYKGDQVTWPKKRIAFQIKAMLEHAEVSITKADELSFCSSINKTDKKTTKLHLTINLIKSFWKDSQLPDDMQRLAENVLQTISVVKIGLPRLKQILYEEQKKGKGPALLNLSPYGVIVQSIMYNELELFKGFMQQPATKIKLLVPKEISLPPELEGIETNNLITIN